MLTPRPWKYHSLLNQSHNRAGPDLHQRPSQMDRVKANPAGGGVGVCVPATEQCQEVRIAVPIDGEERQTDSMFELLVVIAALKVFTTVLTCVCVVTDSEYVYLRATSKAEKWRAPGWMGSNGPLLNVHPWVE